MGAFSSSEFKGQRSKYKGCWIPGWKAVKVLGEGNQGQVALGCRIEDFEKSGECAGATIKLVEAVDWASESAYHGVLQTLGMTTPGSDKRVAAELYDASLCNRSNVGVIVSEELDADYDVLTRTIIDSENLSEAEKKKAITFLYERVIEVLDRLHNFGKLAHNDTHNGNFMVKLDGISVDDLRDLNATEIMQALEEMDVLVIDFGMMRPISGISKENKVENVVKDMDFYILLFHMFRSPYGNFVANQTKRKIAARINMNKIKKRERKVIFGSFFDPAVTRRTDEFIATSAADTRKITRFLA